MKKKKLIVWFYPENKKEQRNQFHTLASNVKEAMSNCLKLADFKFRIVGVSTWQKYKVNPNEFISNVFK